MEFRRFESAAPLTANGTGSQKPMNGNQNNLRNIVVWIIIGLLVLALINLLSPTSQRAPSSEHLLYEAGRRSDARKNSRP